jgi:serine/threonine-protein kinase RsbW
VLYEFIEGLGHDLGLEDALVLKLNLALEEAVSNVILYAYPKNRKKNRCFCVSLKGSDLIFTVYGLGSRLNLHSRKTQIWNYLQKNVPIGGLGIYLIQTDYE